MKILCRIALAGTLGYEQLCRCSLVFPFIPLVCNERRALIMYFSDLHKRQTLIAVLGELPFLSRN